MAPSLPLTRISHLLRELCKAAHQSAADAEEIEMFAHEDTPKWGRNCRTSLRNRRQFCPQRMNAA